MAQGNERGDFTEDELMLISRIKDGSVEWFEFSAFLETYGINWPDELGRYADLFHEDDGRKVSLLHEQFAENASYLVPEKVQKVIDCIPELSLYQKAYFKSGVAVILAGIQTERLFAAINEPHASLNSIQAAIGERPMGSATLLALIGRSRKHAVAPIEKKLSLFFAGRKKGSLAKTTEYILALIERDPDLGPTDIADKIFRWAGEEDSPYDADGGTSDVIYEKGKSAAISRLQLTQKISKTKSLYSR